MADDSNLDAWERYNPDPFEAVREVARSLDDLSDAFQTVGNDVMCDKLDMYAWKLRRATESIERKQDAKLQADYQAARSLIGSMTAAVVAGCIRPAESK